MVYLADVTQGVSKPNSTDFIGGYLCLIPSGLKLTPTG